MALDNIKTLLGINTETEKALGGAVEALDVKVKTLEDAKESYSAVYEEIDEKLYTVVEEKEHALEQLQELNGNIDDLESFEEILEQEKAIAELNAMVSAYERQHSNLIEQARETLYNPANELLTADLALKQALYTFKRETQAFRNDSNKEHFKTIEQDAGGHLVDRSKVGEHLHKLDLLEINQLRNAQSRYIFNLV